MGRTLKRIAKIVALLEEHNPADCLAVETLCGITLEPLPGADGAFRDVYYSKGLPLVFKFPRNLYDTGHSRSEIKTIRRILSSKKKYAKLQKYMPHMYYGNTKTGVIVMHKYKPYPYRKNNNDRHVIGNLLETIFDLVWPEKESQGITDVSTCNIAMNDHGNPVVIDLGYFTPEGK